MYFFFFLQVWTVTVDKQVLFSLSFPALRGSQVLSFSYCSSSNEIFGFRLRLI